MLKTLTNFEEIQSPIFRIDLVLNQAFGKRLVPIAAISTDDIGFREGASEQVMLAVAKMFQVDYKRSLSNPHGPIDLLIGLDDQRLLLKEMTEWPLDVPNTFREIRKSPFMQDLCLAQTVLSDRASVKGAIGGFDNGTTSNTHNLRALLGSLSFQAKSIKINGTLDEADLTVKKDL